MDKYYVYIYLDPRKPRVYQYGSYEFKCEPFYIGKGSRNRWKDNRRNKYFKNKLNKIKKSGLEPIIIKFRENLDEKNSFILELELINLIGRKDLRRGPLINFTDGGEGVSGRICLEETRKLLIENHADIKGENHPNYGKHPSDETRKKQSEKMKDRYKGKNHPMFGKHHSEETIKLMRENHANFKGENHPMFGRHHTEEMKRKQSEKMKGKNNPMFGKYRTEESKKKQSEKMKGKYRGENSSNSILTKKGIIEIKKLLEKEILTQKEIAEKFGVKQSTISNIKTGRTWSHVGKKL